MGDNQFFIRAIQADSAAATCLVYADWLEERGERPRAEFIRVQCELEGLPSDAARRNTLEAREAELLTKHRAEWTRDLRKIVGDFGFVRGVVTWGAGKAKKFVDHADEVFRMAPIQHMRLNDSKEVAEQLAQCSGLQNLQTVCLESNPIGAARAEVLLASPFLSNVTTLILNHNHIGLRGIRTLTASPHLGRLKRLALVGNNLNDEAMSFLGNAAHLTNLQELFLGTNSFSVSGLEALVSAPVAANLRLLSLGWGSALRDQIVPILVSSSNLKNLRYLMPGDISERSQRELKQRFGPAGLCFRDTGYYHHGSWKPRDIAVE